MAEEVEVVMTNEARARKMEEKKQALLWARSFTQGIIDDNPLEDFVGDAHMPELPSIFHQRPPQVLWGKAEQHLSMTMNTAGWLLED